MYLSNQDRAVLQEALARSLTTMENPELRTMFSLMLALLSDLQELDAAR